MSGLQESPYFSILADECQNISTQEELSICGRCLVNGKPEEHFLTVLCVRSKDAGTIAEALQSFLQQKQVDIRKLIGQRYDGTATFAGRISEVHKRIQTSLLMQSTSTVLVTVTVHFNSGSYISEGDKDVFWNHDQRLEVVLLFPSKSRGIEGHPGCSWFS